MIDVGYKNFIIKKRIKTILKPHSARAKWLKREALAGRTLIDCTQGRKTNSLLILDSNHLILSPIHFQTLNNNLNDLGLIVEIKE